MTRACWGNFLCAATFVMGLVWIGAPTRAGAACQDKVTHGGLSCIEGTKSTCWCQGCTGSSGVSNCRENQKGTCTQLDDCYADPTCTGSYVKITLYSCSGSKSCRCTGSGTGSGSGTGTGSGTGR
jgi:hypothetical protein